MADNQPAREGAEDAKEIGALEALWGLFGSMKTAIVLLLLIAAASVAGTIIEQNASPEAYIKHYGQATYGVIRALGLTDLYHTGWYVLLLSLFSLNLAVCSIKRFGIAWRRTFQPKVSADAEQVAGLQRSEEIDATGAPDDVASKVVAALRGRRYHVVSERSGDSTSVYATRGRLGIWGPYLTHVSILVIFAGAVAGNHLGTHGRVIIAEGERADSYYSLSDATTERGHEQLAKLGFTVGVKSFTIQHDKMHRPTGYKSHLQVYDGGELVDARVVDVNFPLTYKGTSFYQSSYGLERLVLKVTAPGGESKEISYKIRTVETPKGPMYGVPSSDDPMRQVELGGKKLTIFIHNIVPDYIGGEMLNASSMPLNPACDILINDRFPEYKGLDAWTRLGWMPVSGSAEYKGYTITLARAVDYTVLDVSRNPGLPVIYIGFGLILLGVFLSFYTAHKVVRVSISPKARGSRVVAGATSRAGASVFDKDFDRLRKALS